MTRWRRSAGSRWSERSSERRIAANERSSLAPLSSCSDDRADASSASLIGVVAGVLSGLFGVGGGIITTPAIQELLGGSPYIAVGTRLPVAIPTALVGGYTYAALTR